MPRKKQPVDDAAAERTAKEEIARLGRAAGMLRRWLHGRGKAEPEEAKGRVVLMIDGLESRKWKLEREEYGRRDLAK